MRFMVLVKATRESEAGVMPEERLLKEMGDFNAELAKAGVLVSGEGLHPTSKAVRVHFEGEGRTVEPGPFDPPESLVAGYWVWKCASLEEAIGWARRCPNPMPGKSQLEIRQVFEMEDFGEAMTPEMREQEEHIRQQLAGTAPD